VREYKLQREVKERINAREGEHSSPVQVLFISEQSWWTEENTQMQN
jgi:hypothetical protein